MRRMVFRSIAKLGSAPMELFWLAGLVRNERNEWNVLAVYRNTETGELSRLEQPIGMLPIMSVGIRFEHGVLKVDELPGEVMEIVIPDMGRPDIITSAEVPFELYPLPQGKSGTQRLFRYRTQGVEVLIPVIELVRALFLHNRTLALALMRPSGLEQLFVPQHPGQRDIAMVQFTREMPKSVIGKALALEFAWIVLDRDARRSWDSVQRLTAGQRHVLFDPPSIRSSNWVFRGVRHGNQWLVQELKFVGGRRLPFAKLEYSHPAFTKVTALLSGGGGDPAPGPSAPEGDEEASTVKDFDVDDGEEGSTSYRGPQIVDAPARRSAFENSVIVAKAAAEVKHHGKKPGNKAAKRPKNKRTRIVEVSSGERAGTAKLPPLEFRLLHAAPDVEMGDLDALDETVRHMRDQLPDVHFAMTLVQLKQGHASSTIGARPRPAMVVTIDPHNQEIIVLIDIERTGVIALSLMSMRFPRGSSPHVIEDAVGKMLDGWVELGGHWSTELEKTLEDICACERVPRVLIPREKFRHSAKMWANRLMDRLGLTSS
jgi:hypothetical protein